MRQRRPTSRSPSRRRGAFTLIEALIATGILAMSTLALSHAIAAGQQNSVEGQKMVVAAMVASDLLSELTSVPYNNLKSYDGRTSSPGGMLTLDSVPYPTSTYWFLGRRLSVKDQTITEPTTGAIIKGLQIIVAVHDGSRDVLSIEVFVPEPAA